jgi:hypothetical protein
VTNLAYALIVLIPLSAFITVGIALRPGRPTPGRTWPTSAITSRIQEIEAQVQQPSGLGDAKALQRERKKLHAELLRRGLGR